MAAGGSALGRKVAEDRNYDDRYDRGSRYDRDDRRYDDGDRRYYSKGGHRRHDNGLHRGWYKNR
ncbi:hypothetical protein ACINWC141_2566 [Acinetobacter sp. WC-141]|nr:hypothetical protein ACINWC141_2566 [Acinetobacter sp. WC-141]